MFFDKEYYFYKAFEYSETHKTGFVTRIKNNAYYRKIKYLDVADYIDNAVLEDQIIEVDFKIIEVDVKKGKEKITLKLRKVNFYDSVHKREFEFSTNLFDLRADLIILI